MRFFLISVIIHLSVLFYLTIPENKQESIPIEVVIPKNPISPPKAAPGQIGKEGRGTTNPPKRIGNNGEGLDNLNIGERLTVENYIERIRAIIEPPWRKEAGERIKFRRKAKYSVIKCTTTLILTIEKSGHIIKKEVVLSCGQDLHFDAIALSVWNQNLPPPPKNLLIDDLLELVWSFIIR